MNVLSLIYSHIYIFYGFCFVVAFQASLFAVRMGFPYEDLTTQKSLAVFSQWLNQSCQPNYWKVQCSGGEDGFRKAAKQHCFFLSAYIEVVLYT